MSGFNDPDYNTRQQISSLRRQMQHMETEIHNLRTASVPACRFCGEQIGYQSQVFRCADCEAPFHRECIRKHFANEPHPASALSRPHGGGK
jgi:hypothetical protein